MTIEGYVQYYEQYEQDDLYILMDRLNTRYMLTDNDIVVSDIRNRVAAIWKVLGNK